MRRNGEMAVVTCIIQVSSAGQVVRIFRIGTDSDIYFKECARALVQWKFAQAKQDRFYRHVFRMGFAKIQTLDDKTLDALVHANRTHSVNDQRAAPVRAPDPVYPEAAERKGLTGEVVMEITIGTDGIISDVKVVRSSDESFTAAAKEALKAWRFIPEIKAGQAVSTTLPLTFTFGRTQRPSQGSTPPSPTPTDTSTVGQPVRQP